MKESRMVYKYLIVSRQMPRVTLVPLPKGARVLKFDFQEQRPHIWCEVSPNASEEVRTFGIVATGQAVPADASWVGTCLDGEYGWHLYELGVKKEGR